MGRFMQELGLETDDKTALSGLSFQNCSLTYVK